MSSAPIVVRNQATVWWKALLLGLRGALVKITLRTRTAHVGGRTKPLERFERGLPHVVCHGGILEADVTWDRDRVLRLRRAFGGEENLGTADIELRVRWALVCLVQGKKRRPNQIISRFEILRNRHGQMTLVGDQFLGAPLFSIIVVAVDAEPSISNGLILDGRVDLLHVDFAGPLVALVNGTRNGSVRPIAILKGELRPCVGITNPSDAVLAVDP